jgi:putative PEP-CTERM system histidine kinase
MDTVQRVIGVFSFWNHALAAGVFATLLLWQLRKGARGTGQWLLLAGLLMTALWTWLIAVGGSPMLVAHAETARTLVWIALLHSFSATDDAEGPQLRGVGLLYAAVSAALGLQLVVDTMLHLEPGPNAALIGTSLMLRLTAAAGSLVLVHNLYGQAAPASRGSIRLAMGALAAGWVYDLNLYTVALLSGGAAVTLTAWRGTLLLATAPLFALGGQRAEGWRIRLSRAATFQSLSLLVICSYFALSALLATVLHDARGSLTQAGMIGLLAAMTVAVMVLLPSARARSWAKVKIAKHFFEHRYDYRAEWLRFTATLGTTEVQAAPLAERVIQGFAAIAEAPAGLLLETDERGLPALAAAWQWAGPVPSAPQLEELGEAIWPALQSGRVLELDQHRRGLGSLRDRTLRIPAWLTDDVRFWAGVPLVHGERLVGLVLLGPPELRRALDWEDFDLLRTAGRQAASSLAEAHGQNALMNAQRFEEFNRRFAFILHDVKNLVSQLSLLSRNAERHADNSEFRADMVATLKSSVGKMNDLLARLAPNGEMSLPTRARGFSLLGVLSAAIAANRHERNVRLFGPASLSAIGDPAGLEQAVGHLLQNAVEASTPGSPVVVRVAADERHIRIDISDEGCGMDSDFVRNRLFQPFASTKPGGFGIGAFEARSLVQAMGGHLSVASQPGGGTRFTIRLPAAANDSAEAPALARKHA